MLTLSHLGRYEIETEIGRGAMGVVYRARDPKIDRTVAIKTISLAGQEPADEKEYRQRFAQEARAAGRLSHPGIVTIFDAGEDPETREPYLVMEYVAGEPLSKFMSGADGKLSLAAALQFAQEVAEALDYAHSQGVVHRDIKPANILITEDGHAKVADFGVARLNQELLTQPGGIVGSPAYMAPEQMAGEEADARSDLFSLGVALYSMITGFRPFQGNSAQTVCFKVMNIEPVPVTSFQHEVPTEIDAVISRAIAKIPDDRYQSGAEMALDIQALRERNPSLALPNNFLARVMQQDTGRGRAGRKFEPGLKRTLSLGAALLGVFLSGALFAWRMTRALSMPLSAPVLSEAQLRPLPAHFAPPAEMVPPPMKVAAHKSRKHNQQPDAPGKTEALAPARVQVEIQHHFNAANASIWLDNALVFDQALRGADQRHPLLRVVEMNQIASLQFASGKHRLQIRIASPINSYDQIETLEAELSAGSKYVLRVNCDKRKMQATLQ